MPKTERTARRGPARKRDRKTQGGRRSNRRRPTTASRRTVEASDPGPRSRKERAARPAGSPPAGRPWLRRLVRVGLRLGITGTVAWALLVAASEGYDYATTSPRFEVRALLFEPTPHVTDEQLRELMQLTPGTNILSLDPEDVAARVAADPWVAKAAVVRVLPDALQVEVTEHEARAVLLTDDFYLVDAQGNPFKRLDRGERRRMPVITGIDGPMMLTEPARAGERIARALEALDAWDTKKRPRLGEVHVATAGEVTLYTAELGSQLRLGRGPLPEALDRYDALRAALGDEADALAVVHLDHTRGPDRPDRVVASFLPSQGAPAMLEEAHEQAEAEAAAKAEAVEARAEAKRAENRHGRAQTRKKKSRLPRYE